MICNCWKKIEYGDRGGKIAGTTAGQRAAQSP
jgi:hypothetical protein